MSRTYRFVLLLSAILFALQLVSAQSGQQETNRPKDLSDQVKIFGRVAGPLPEERGGTNGIILRHGYIAAEFGGTTRKRIIQSIRKTS